MKNLIAEPKRITIKYKPNPPKKRTEEKTLITKILPYSAKKRRAKPPPPYSILKPETSSDSPSAKSKGARLVSAKTVTNHTKKIGRRIKEKENLT